MNGEYNKAADVLNSGGVCIIPTDTLYGLVGRALDTGAVAKIHKLKNRSDNKPFIILVSSLEDLHKLNIDIDEESKNFLSSVWPGPVSVILSCIDDGLRYLHNGMDLAIRWPKDEKLTELIKQTGPLVAPSANPEGAKPAHTIQEAEEYFGDSVDFYFDGGVLDGEPSTLISLNNGEIKILRQGRGQL